MALVAKGKPIDPKLHEQIADVGLPPERRVGAILVTRSPPMPSGELMRCQRAVLQRDDSVEMSDLGSRDSFRPSTGAPPG